MQEKTKCPEAYHYYKKGAKQLLIGAIFTVIPVIGLPLDLAAISNAEKVLPVYNANCAGK